MTVNAVAALEGLARLPFRPARRMRWRASPSLDHAQLRWYPNETVTYRLVARHLVPAALWLLADVTVEGLANIPVAGPAILAANHRDNWDGYLLLHLVPRTVHLAARPDAFGTGPLCAVWRRLGIFPADPWGLRFALDLLAEGQVVAVFPQGRISRELDRPLGAAGVLALHSGAPVVPTAITGTDAVRPARSFGKRASVSVHFGPATTFARADAGARGARAVSEEVLRQVAALLPDDTAPGPAG